PAGRSPQPAELAQRGRLAVRSAPPKPTPVRLPRGRARLAAQPCPHGAAPPLKTIGIVEVALFAASAEGGLLATINSTLRPTREAGQAGRRGRWARAAGS